MERLLRCVEFTNPTIDAAAFVLSEGPTIGSDNANRSKDRPWFVAIAARKVPKQLQDVHHVLRREENFCPNPFPVQGRALESVIDWLFSLQTESLRALEALRVATQIA
jgi:hypothetical protein